MKKTDEAKQILSELGLPDEQQNEISALTLLALCGIKPRSKWSSATRSSLKITKGIMAFVSDVYGRNYAPNTRETFRRQVLHQFVQAKIADYNPDNPGLAVNSPNAHYSISEAALKAIKSFGTPLWKEYVNEFIKQSGELKSRYLGQRELSLIPVTLSSGKKLKLSPGKHNEVQAAVIHFFASRFAKGGQVIYLGDTANKELYIDREFLSKLRIPIDKHSKLPDIIIYSEKQDWLYLIEAVTSHGPVSAKRMVELEELLEKNTSGKIYVTAFPSMEEFRKHSMNIAWETEVWIMDIPDHLIHFNGDKFLGPRK
ncbi:MAG: restriction endonuclease [Ignavibacteriaceae bacterium]|nr:restriction endonuclease [Ignavibacteriaceae bacterium]